MAKKPINQKKAEKQRQENLALQRVFNVFLLGLAAECYLFLVYRGYVSGSIDSMLAWDTILQVLAWIGLAAAVGGGAAAVWKRREPKLRRVFLWTAGIGLFFAISGLVMTLLLGRGVTAMCIAVPVLTLLGLVFFLFQHECFFTTIVLAGSLFAVWVCGSGLSGSWRVAVMIGAVLCVIAAAVLALLARKVQQAGGMLRTVRVFSPECDYRILYGACALGGVAVLAALLLPSTAYYLMWALGILLFAEMVYYTTKLM